LAQGTTRGVPIDTDPLLSADSDLLVPSQKAVKAYADTKGDMKLAFVQTNLGAKTFLDTTFLLRNVANTFNASFTNTNTADRIYTLPDTAGTIALTSNLTGYVPYTGATANVDLGANNLFANRIGIGTSNPLHQLHIVKTGANTIPVAIRQNDVSFGTMIRYIGANGNTYGEFGITSGSTPNTYSGDMGGMNYLLMAGGVERMRLFGSGGNVSIGTTSDLARLAVQGASASTGTALLVQNSTPTGLFAVLNNGNVGIGIGAPTSKLHVVGASYFTGGHMQLAGGYSFYTETIRGISASDNNIQIGNTFTGIAFGLHTSSVDGYRWYKSATQLMQLTPNGNLGIGTTSLGAMLHVKTTSTTSKTILLESITSHTANILESIDLYGNTTLVIDQFNRLRINAGSSDGKLIVAPSTFALPLTGRDVVLATQGGSNIALSVYGGASQISNIVEFGNASATSGFVMDPSLRIGIGTSTPNEKLDVRGNIKLVGQLRNTLGNSSFNDTSNIITIGNGATIAQYIPYAGLGIGITTGLSASLQVRGVSATTGTAFIVQNSTPGPLFTINNTGRITFGGAQIAMYPSVDKGASINTGSGGLFIGYTHASGNLSYPSLTVGRPANSLDTLTAGAMNMLTVIGNFAPTSGNATWSWLNVEGTINQTGGANGITRGIYINPTLTAAADYRAIEAISRNNANDTLLKLSNNSRDVLCVKGDNKIGLYNATPTIQGTTAMAAATYTNNGSIDLDTFDGYTIGQVVVQLRNMGILS